MKKTILLPMVLLLTLSIACSVSGLDFFSGDRISGSGDVIELDPDFSDFDSLQIGSAFDVEVIQGDDYRVVIRIDDNLEDYLEVGQRGDEVRIELDPSEDYDYFSITIEAEITMPELASIDLNGASRAKLTGFSSGSAFQADISGASALRGEIAAGDTRIVVSGAGIVDLTGAGSELDVDASGGSNVDLADYPVGDATVNADGASTVVVNVRGTLDVDASGASRVKYLGDPTLGSIQLEGASSVDPK